MAGGVPKRVAALWFRYLKLAQQMGKQIDWSFYREWGSADEIAENAFETWWKTTGRKVFKRSDRLKVVATGDVVTVTIPSTYTVRELRRELGPAVKPYLRRGDRSEGHKYGVTGLVRYRQLALYQRLLEVDLARSHRDEPMREKLRLLLERYDKEITRLDKQTQTIAKKSDGARRARGFKGFRSPKRFLHNVRLGYQWRRKGTAIVENVARGVFPGHGYYRSAASQSGDRAR